MTKLLEREEIDPAWLRIQYLVLLDVMEKMEGVSAERDFDAVEGMMSLASIMLERLGCVCYNDLTATCSVCHYPVSEFAHDIAEMQAAESLDTASVPL